MSTKAKFIKAIYNNNPFDKHSWEHLDLLYEYKGHEYIVTKHNNGYEFDSLYQQHKEEQKRIDEMIKKEKQPIEQYTKGAEEGFELFWKYVEGE